MSEAGNISRGSLSMLRQFVRRSVSPDAQFCELCAGALAPDHQHLLEIEKRNVVCACDACALLFTNQAASHFRRIPRRARMLTDFMLSDAEWDSLLIPISLAFFFNSSSAGRVLAYYPSPAGATESLLDLEYWQPIADQNPVLKQMEPDVEALLVNRLGSAAQYYIVPIDWCYRLVGIIRKNWRGFSGGAEVWKQIDLFFQSLRQACPKQVRADGAQQRQPVNGERRA